MADRAFVDRIAPLTAEQQSAFSIWMGPIALDFSAFVGMRLNEHALHSWDIDVTFNSSATVPENAATLIVDNLEMITRYTGKPDSTERVVTVRTRRLSGTSLSP